MDRPGPVAYDDEVRRHDEVLRRAWAVQPREHVLDIGCGLGQTTCEAARLARAGSALGVEISASAIGRARELAQAQGVQNVTFEHADAQVHRFARERFDLAMSRFGTMFFDDPVAAFANVGRALRPAGRLVMMVWQASDRNEWEVHEPVYYGQDVSAALDWVRGFASTRDVLNRLDPAAAAGAAGRLREMLAAHLSGDGVWFDSRAWIITARRHGTD